MQIKLHGWFKILLGALQIVRKGVYHYAYSFDEQLAYEKYISKIIEQNKKQKKKLMIIF